MTGENSHAKLLEMIEPAKLPKEYGGEAEAEATCIYSERGPWTQVENKINYAAPAGSSEFFSGGGNEAIDILNDNGGQDEF